jgi:hypothetical protein
MSQHIKQKPLSQATQKYLTAKAKENGIKKSILTQVYRRGQGAYLSSGSRNVSMTAWARGRVNSFVSGKGKARQADADLWRKRKA